MFASNDEVEFHPAWYQLVGVSVSYGLHCEPWLNPVPGAHVARAALMMLASQNEAGHLCPVSMTYSAIPALRNQSNLALEWEPGILSHEFDPRFRPARDQSGILGSCSHAVLGAATRERVPKDGCGTLRPQDIRVRNTKSNSIA